MNRSIIRKYAFLREIAVKISKLAETATCFHSAPFLRHLCVFPAIDAEDGELL